MAGRDHADLPAGRINPALSYLWALVPLFTAGWGTAFALGWAAYRLRSRRVAIMATAALLITIAAIALSGSASGSGPDNLFGFLLTMLVGGGLAVTFTLRHRLAATAYRHPGRQPPAASRDGGANWPPRRPGLRDQAVEQALARRQRRLEARHLLDQDPALARELRIGRPDLPRQFDDGGLIDVNHVPTAILADLPGFTPQLAEHVARIREQRHGFTLLEELDVYADLPEGLADELAERLIFLR